jgi:hypothetical protein
MEIQMFPIVDATTRPLDAFNVLRSENRSALVVPEGPQFSFIDAADIVFAHVDRLAQHLAQISKKTSLPVFQDTLPPVGVFDFRDPMMASRVESYMDARGVRFVILAMTYSRALVASRHEPDMDPKQASPRDCYCRTDREPVEQGVDHGNCPHDPTHVGTVRCV